MGAHPATAIILPAHNEEATIARTIEEFHRAAPWASIVVVDNGSDDATRRIAEETLGRLGCFGVVLSEARRGKANALRKAFREVNAEIYVMADADSTYSAGDLERLLLPVISGEADLTIGNRHANDVYRSQNRRLFHDFGNRLVSWLVGLLSHADLQDVLSGYRAMSGPFVRAFPIRSQGFEVETEMTLFALKNQFRLKEVPVSYRSRPPGSQSKLRTLQDGARIVGVVLGEISRFRSSRA